MKNGKMKLNKTKIIARVMLVFTIMVSMALFACAFFIGDVDEVVQIKDFNSHRDFANFLQEYNSESDSTTSSFISFDFDNYDVAFDKYYIFRTRSTKNAKNLYDKNTFDTNVELFFYLDKDAQNSENSDFEYKIKCSYVKPEKTFSRYDAFEIKLLDENEMSGEYSINSIDYQDERLPVNEDNNKYTYAYSLALLINGEREMSIKISSTRELDEAGLNSISKTLLDNMVIINTEG